MTLPLLFALAHPGLMWTGLALVSVPILIHLFFRRRHRVVRWAAMEFLLAALRKQKRRMEVENLILLLVRIALIALLGLALARPAVEASSFNAMGVGARAVALVIDTSASMGALLNGRPMLDRARERASKTLLDLPEESRVTLLVSRGDGSGAPQVLVESATPADARARLGGITLAYGPNDLASVFRLAGRKLKTMRGRAMVLFLSDLQRRDWLPGGARHDDLHGALRQLATDEGQSPPVVLLDVNGGDFNNVVVTDLVIDEGLEAFAPSVLGLSAAVVNFGTAPASGRIALFVGRADGGWERKQSVEVKDIVPTLASATAAEFARKEVQFHLPIRKEDEGPLPIKVLFEPDSTGDRLESDNQRFLAIHARPPVRFLPVRNYEGALNVLRDMETIEVIEFEQAIYPNDLSDEDLTGIDVVLWADANIHDLDAEGATKLEKFVRGGGAFLAYLGTEARPDKVNAAFFKEYRDGSFQGLFPFMLADGNNMPIDDENPTHIDIESARGPLFREMAESPGLFYSPDIIGFRALRKDTQDLDAYVKARYVNGEPAVLVHRLGRGLVVAVTTTPDERAIRLNGSILPAAFFFNAAHFLVEQDPRLRNVLVGETIVVSLPPSAKEIIVEQPERAGGTIREPITEPDAPYRLSSTGAPGIYRIAIKSAAASATSGLPSEKRHVAAVNLHPSESDLRRAGASELEQAYRAGGVKLMFSSDVEEALPEATDTTGELARTLLGIVVALLGVELFLAWYFGNRRKAGSA